MDTACPKTTWELWSNTALKMYIVSCITFPTGRQLPLEASHPGAYKTRHTFISFSLTGSQSIMLRVQVLKKYINQLSKWCGNMSNVLGIASQTNVYTEKLSSHIGLNNSTLFAREIVWFFLKGSTIVQTVVNWVTIDFSKELHFIEWFVMAWLIADVLINFFNFLLSTVPFFSKPGFSSLPVIM